MKLHSFALTFFTISSVFGLTNHGVPLKPTSNQPTNYSPISNQVDSYAALPACKTGFKRGKTPVSLVAGAKAGCYNVATAAKGKKLLTKDTLNTCVTCHSSLGVSPVSQMNSNMRNQGYTLSAANITAAFNAHAAEMNGALMTSAQAKWISHYLQSIK